MKRELNQSILLAFAFVMNIAAYPVLFGHHSTGGTIFGQYSPRYAVVLIVTVIVSIIWAGLWLIRGRFAHYVEIIPSSLRYIFLLFIILFGTYMMTLPIEDHIRAYLGLNTIMAIAVLSYPMTDTIRYPRIWQGLLIVGLVVFLYWVLVGTLTQRPYHPDDAHWADAATTFWQKGGLYTDTWHEEPIKIVPGAGWANALYGWVLINVDFDLRVGRFIRFCMNMLLALGMGMAIGRLYGRRVAYVTILIALTQFYVVLDGSYRPHVMVLAMYFFMIALLLTARASKGTLAYLLYFVLGLSVTLSMEFHAIGLALALGISIFYVADFFWQGFGKDNWAYWRMVLAYGVGALLGTLIYYFANIAAVGGLDVFLNKLLDERYRSTRSLQWLSLPLFEQTLILAGWGYLLWRRSHADRLLMALISTLILSTFLVDTQGYGFFFVLLLMLPMALPIVQGLTTSVVLPKRVVWVTAAILMIMGMWLGQARMEKVSLMYTLIYHKLPKPEIDDIGEAIVPYVRQNEVIVTTHELIWTFYNYPNLTSYAAETQLQRYKDYDTPSQVWEEIQPDVIVDIPRRVETPPGLAVYQETYFEECHRLFVRSFDIIIYRQDCADSPIPENQ